MIPRPIDFWIARPAIAFRYQSPGSYEDLLLEFACHLESYPLEFPAASAEAPLIDGQNRRKPTVRCTKVRGLSLIHSRRVRQRLALIGVAANVDLERLRV